MPFKTAPKQSHSLDSVPFRPAEQAWFWTSRVLRARRQGCRGKTEQPVSRPCSPDDVLRCLAQLYRAGHIDLVHARILRKWGERGQAPDGRAGGDRNDYQRWRAALDRLEEVLRARGIVAGIGFDPHEVDATPFFKLNGQSHHDKNFWLTRCSTTDRTCNEANLDGSLIATRTAGVSRSGTTRLLPLAAISPPNPDQLGVAPSGATLSFFVPRRTTPTLSKKEI